VDRQLIGNDRLPDYGKGGVEKMTLTAKIGGISPPAATGC